MKVRRYGHLIPYAALVVIATVMLYLLKMPMSRLDVPYTFFGDALDKLAQIRNVAETGWLFHNDRLGYPFGYDRLDFPRFDSLNYVILGPLAALTGEPGMAMNLYFLASFYLIAFSAFYCLRRLGLDTAPAALCALLYAFLPYHVLRGEAHLTNGAYFLVPPAMLVLVRVAEARFGFDTTQTRRRWLLALLVALLLPLQMPYNGFFFAFLCVVAAAIAYARQPRWRPVLVALSLMAATACAFVIEQVPVWVHALQKGKTIIADRLPMEAQLYSLRLNQVMLPTNVDRRREVVRAINRFDDAMNVPFAEVRNQYIGVFGILGFAALLWALFRTIDTREVPSRASTELETAVRISALFAIAVVLLAVSSGIGTVIAYWITAKVRAYNRILPFLAFPCLLGAGWALQVLTTRIRRPWVRNAVIASVAILAVFDTLVRPQNGTRVNDIASYDRERAYFRAVEKRLDRDAAVFQLPAAWYPEYPPLNDMGTYESFKPFLLTDSLRFSFGNGRGRAGYAWASYIARQPAMHLIARVHAMGFAAILIDGSAFNADALKTTTDALARALPESPTTSIDRRWWLFPLKGCCGPPVPQLTPGQAPTVFAYEPDRGPLRFTYGGGGSLYEAGGWQNPEDWGTWSLTEARLRMKLTPAPQGAIALTLDTQMMVGPFTPQRMLRVECNGRRVGEFTFTQQSAAQQLHIDVPAGLIDADGLMELHFVTTPEATPQSAGVNSDGRSLALGLIAMTIATAP